MAAVEAAERAGVTLIVTVDCGTTPSPRSPRPPRAGSTSSSPTITGCRRCCRPAVAIVNPHRSDSLYPDARLAGSGVAFKVAQLVLAERPGWAGRGPRHGRSRDDRDRGRRRADRRREPGHRPSRPRADATDPRPGIAALLETGSGRPGRGRPRDRRVRPGAAAERRRPDGRGASMRRTSSWRTTPRRPAVHADALEAANLTRRDLMKAAVGEARAMVAASGQGRRRRVDRARTVDGRDRRARRVTPRRGPRPARDRRRGARRRRARVVPQ